VFVYFCRFCWNSRLFVSRSAA